MRAIDADALYKNLNDIRKEEIILHGRLNNENCCTLSTALYEIGIAPTIEPERKKGKWQITDAYPHNVYCSECHTRFAQTHWAVWEDGSLPRKFCPNCGSYNGGDDHDL